MGAPIVGWGTMGWGGLPRGSGVEMVAGCSGIGGEVEAVLEEGGWGACRCGEKGVGREGVSTVGDACLCRGGNQVWGRCVR